MQPGPVIFLVSHSSPGGAQEVWANLAEAFRAAGYDTRLLALYPWAGGGDAALQARWSKVHTAKPSGVAGAVRLVLALSRVFRRDRPAMVFSAMPAANVASPLAAWLAGAGTRVCISHHSPVFSHQRFLNLLDSLTGSLACTRNVVVVSDVIGSSLGSKPAAYRRKCRTIHNALPPQVVARLRQLRAARRERAAPGRRVVAVGRLSPEKNYPVLLRAAVHMADVELVIAGSGPLERPLKQLADSLGISARTRFLGHITRAQAMEVLASGDVFAQPSQFEGHSLALLEAAELGLPLVVSDVAPQIEAITGADGVRRGIAVGLHDDRALAGAVLGLLEEPARYRHWASAAAQLADESSFARMVLEYQSLAAP